MDDTWTVVLESTVLVILVGIVFIKIAMSTNDEKGR